MPRIDPSQQLVGLSRTEETMNEPSFSGAAEMISETLTVLFLMHGIEVEKSGPLLRVPSHPDMTIRGEAHWPVGPHVVRLDVLLTLPDGRELCESCAGMHRETPQALLSDALATFSENALSVLVASFFHQPPPSDVSQEIWTIRGQARDVYLGSMTSRFGAPGGESGGYEFSQRFFNWIEDWLSRSSLPPGDHWVRVYQSRQRGEIWGTEVVLDNHPWPKAEAELAGIEWPAEPDPSDARVFLVIRDRV